MKNQTVFYEWDLESFEITDGVEDIIDHDHYDKCPGIPNNMGIRLVLVRDSYVCGSLDRTWAYVVDGKLPEYFKDAHDNDETKVPVRFHKELLRVTL